MKEWIKHAACEWYRTWANEAAPRRWSTLFKQYLFVAGLSAICALIYQALYYLVFGVLP